MLQHRFTSKNILRVKYLKLMMKCINKTASCNDETCPLDELFGLKEDPPSQE